jgi:hypothetical protein
VGFLDGMELGRSFSYWGFAQQREKSACVQDVETSYIGYSAKYLSHVTAGQIQDGLNTFYADYRNRRITVDHAVWLVLSGIAGTPQDELEKTIENFRRNAANF